MFAGLVRNAGHRGLRGRGRDGGSCLCEGRGDSADRDHGTKRKGADKLRPPRTRGARGLNDERHSVPPRGGLPIGSRRREAGRDPCTLTFTTRPAARANQEVAPWPPAPGKERSRERSRRRCSAVTVAPTRCARAAQPYFPTPVYLARRACRRQHRHRGRASDNSNIEAAWIFTRSGGVWPSRATSCRQRRDWKRSPRRLGRAVRRRQHRHRGGLGDNSNVGAAWVFTQAAVCGASGAQAGRHRRDPNRRPRRLRRAVRRRQHRHRGRSSPTTPTSERRGSLPAAAVSGTSGAPSWSAPAQLAAPTKAGPSRCLPTTDRRRGYGGTWPLALPALTYWSGVWATVVLLMALAVTPAATIFRWPALIDVRRMIGVTALVYTIAHVVIYFAFRRWDFRPSRTILTTTPHADRGDAFDVGLIVLGATSVDAVIRYMDERTGSGCTRRTM